MQLQEPRLGIGDFPNVARASSGGLRAKSIVPFFNFLNSELDNNWIIGLRLSFFIPFSLPQDNFKISSQYFNFRRSLFSRSATVAFLIVWITDLKNRTGSSNEQAF